MNYYTLTPHDVLFFRDGRPTETGGGHGARWPEPSVVFDALHAALWRAFPERQTAWEHDHRYGRSSYRQPSDGPRTQRFGSLLTAGIFPVWKDGRWLFPAPADTTADKSDAGWLLALQKPVGAANLPSPLRNLPKPMQRLLASQATPSKETVAPWWSRVAWQDYLGGKRPEKTELFHAADLYAEEWTTGIGMDSETQTQDGTRIYSAQYLRLKADIRCGFAATLPMKRDGNGDDIRECMGQLFGSTGTIIVGGQQRACRVESCEPSSPLPVGPKINGRRVKWVLLTPSIWPQIKAVPEKGIAAHPGGWLPNWIDPESGDVRLRFRSGRIRRVWSEEKQRTVREAEVDETIHAKLITACAAKAVPVVGWTERLHLLKDEQERRYWEDESGAAHGPRATHLAVPAGAVYYFECPDEMAAQKLAAALNWHGGDASPTTIRNRRSTLMGEKGFGLGVCGPWQDHPEASQQPA